MSYASYVSSLPYADPNTEVPTTNWQLFDPYVAQAAGATPEQIYSGLIQKYTGMKSPLGYSMQGNIVNDPWVKSLPLAQQQAFERARTANATKGSFGDFLGALAFTAAPFAIGSMLGTLGSSAGGAAAADAAGGTGLTPGATWGLTAPTAPALDSAGSIGLTAPAAGGGTVAAGGVVPSSFGASTLAPGLGAGTALAEPLTGSGPTGAPLKEPLSGSGPLGSALGTAASSLFGNGSGGSLAQSLLGGAIDASPFLMALNEANKQSGALDSTTNQMEGLLSQIGGNQSDYLNAVTQPLEQQYQTNRYNMQNDMANRGILGSSLADATLGNYDRLANSALSNARASALQGSYDLQGKLLNNIYNAKNQSALNRNLLLGSGLNAAGHLFDSGNSSNSLFGNGNNQPYSLAKTVGGKLAGSLFNYLGLGA